MSCTNLLQATLNLLDGKIKFLREDPDSFHKKIIDYGGRYFYLPCRKCISCRLSRSRDWAIRCMHEASLYDANLFLTLTYDDEHLPEGLTLVKKHVQDFLKRLRKRVLPSPLPEGHPGIRYFYCGEYGEKRKRPHYHLCLFNFWPEDARLHQSSDGYNLYTSALIEDLWGKGFCPFGSLTFQSAAYTARYICKKVFGKKAQDHYIGRLPEYCDMSRSSGIGKDWIAKYWQDVYPKDFCRYKDEFKCKPPAYYDDYMLKFHPDVFSFVKAERQRLALEQGFAEVMPDRLLVKSKVKQAKFDQLVRNLESDL